MSRPKKQYPFGRYLHYHTIRLLRLPDNHHNIALGVAWGVFISFTPLLGFHLILATLLCVIFGGSKVASWIGTLIGNPATFPIFFWSDYQLGSWLLRMDSGGGALSALASQGQSITTFLEQVLSFVWSYGKTFIVGGQPVEAAFTLEQFWIYYAPIMLGGVILGGLVGAGFYYATYRFVDLTRRGRERRILVAKERNQQRSYARDRVLLEAALQEAEKIKEEKRYQPR
ncbi:MAG: DUF2062 domain-containing protein [Magnetococcales bacterium]|nr:DUF2062 domain-containing protein [Magnetococcales bacterium]